jgi:hypothetical protein
LQILDEIQPSPLLRPSELQSTRAMIRDSLAWALYRQKKYQEALRQQRQAMKEAQQAGVTGRIDRVRSPAGHRKGGAKSSVE